MGQQLCISDWVSENDRDGVIGYRVDVGAVVLYGVKFVNAGHLSVCLRVAGCCACRCPGCERGGGKAGGGAADVETVRFRVLDYGGWGGIVEVANFGAVAALGENEVVQLLVGCEWDHNMLVSSGRSGWMVRDHYSGKKDQHKPGDNSESQTEGSPGFGANLHGCILLLSQFTA